MTCHCDARGMGRRSKPIGYVNVRPIGDVSGKLATTGEDAAIGAAAGAAVGSAVPLLGTAAGGVVGTYAGGAYGVVDQFGGDIKNAASDVGGFISGLFGGGSDPHHPAGGSQFTTSPVAGQEVWGGWYKGPPPAGRCWIEPTADNPGLVALSEALRPGYRCKAPWGVGQEPIPQAAPAKPSLAAAKTSAAFVGFEERAAAAAAQERLIHKAASGGRMKLTVASPVVPPPVTAAAVVKAAPPPKAPLSTGAKVAIGVGGLGLVAAVGAALLRVVK